MTRSRWLALLTLGFGVSLVIMDATIVNVALPVVLSELDLTAADEIRASLERLGVERTDLHLIHWPNPSQGKYVEAWRALVQLQRDGLVRSIGVSNFTEEHLARIIDDTGVVPAVNQVELHPLFPQAELRAEHERLGIRTESWSPLGKRQAPFGADPVAAAASAHGVEPAQVILRWEIQSAVLPIPKSSNPKRMAENLDVFGWELSDQQMERIRLLHTGLSGSGFDPDEHEEI